MYHGAVTDLVFHTNKGIVVFYVMPDKDVKGAQEVVRQLFLKKGRIPHIYNRMYNEDMEEIGLVYSYPFSRDVFETIDILGFEYWLEGKIGMGQT